MPSADIISFFTNNLPLLLQGTLVTLKITLISIVIGTLLGFVFAVANCERVRVAGVSHLLTVYITLFRGTPIFVQLLIVYFALPNATGINLSPFLAGVITLSLNSTAYLAETLRGGINSVPVGQWEAARALGYSTFKSLLFVVLPQATKNVLPAITNEYATLIKDSSILMVIGVYELTKASKEIVARDLNPMEIYLLAAFLYLALTTSLSGISKIVEKKMQ